MTTASTATTTASTVIAGFDWSDIATLIAGGLGAVTTLIAAGFAAWLAYRYAVRQLRIAHHQAIRQHRQVHQQALRQDASTQQLAHQYALAQDKTAHNIAVRSDRLRREINALEAVWELLAYMSDKKSNKAIIHFLNRRDAEGKKHVTHFFHYHNLEHFMLDAQSDVFYQQHAGLFMPDDIRDLVYSYRSVAAGFYFAAQRDDNLTIPDSGLLPINKPEQVNKLKGIYDELNARLREELEKRYHALEV